MQLDFSTVNEKNLTLNGLPVNERLLSNQFSAET